jgi:hypothetical protein
MKELCTALLLIPLCGIASADWVKLNDNDRATIYVDSGTRRSGNLVKVWEMRVFKKPQTSGGREVFLTRKMQTEYDCIDDRMRIFYISLHAGQMGSGNVVAQSPASERWTPNPPDSEAKQIQMAVCAK